MSGDLLLAAFGFGLVSTSVLAIAAVGFTMQFGISNMINLAYGGVMIASAYAAFELNDRGVSIWVALVGGAVFGAVMSFLINRVIYAPFQRKGTVLIGMVIISLAVSLMISNGMVPIVGYTSVSYSVDPGATVHVGAIALTGVQLAIIALAVVLMLVIHGLLTLTRLGKAMRATAANPVLARNCGIPTRRVVDLAWLITGALCGVAGTVAGMNSQSFSVSSGAGFLITIIAAAILGGAGSPYGAMVGALVIGEMTELSAAIPGVAQYKEVVAFAVLVVVMVVRPQGLLARRGALAAAG